MLSSRAMNRIPQHALVLALGLALAAGCGGPPDRGEAEAVERVLVVGVDGLEWRASTDLGSGVGYVEFVEHFGGML